MRRSQGKLMSKHGIFIGDDSQHRVEIRLAEILDCIEDGNQLEWSILYLWSEGDLSDTRWGTYLALEEAITQTSAGVRVTWDELRALDSQLGQIYEILIVGSANEANLHKYDDDQAMYDACEHVLEAFDSGFWIIHSQSKQTVECLFSSGFPEAKWDD